MTSRSMFEPFSRGYYVGRLFVEPHGGDRALMQRTSHEEVNRRIYSTGTGIERLDHPLVMKLDTHHFAVHGDDGIPNETLAIPESMIDPTEFRSIPGLREVLLAKSDRATQLLNLFRLDDEPAGF